MYFLSENFAQAENEVQSFEIRGTLVEIRKRICVALSTGIKDTRAGLYLQLFFYCVHKCAGNSYFAS